MSSIPYDRLKESASKLNAFGLSDRFFIVQSEYLQRLGDLGLLSRAERNDFSRRLEYSMNLDALITVAYPEGLPDGSSVLQIGCNYGPFLRYLSITQPNLHLVGVDLAEDAIDFGRKMGKLDIRQMSAFEMTFDDNTFDYVLSDAFIDESYYALFYCIGAGKPYHSNLVAGIKEAHRVLKPGGEFILVAQDLNIRWLTDQGFSVERYEYEDYPFGNLNNAMYICRK